MARWSWSSETSKKDTRKIEELEQILKSNKYSTSQPPSGGSAVNKPTKTKTIEKYDCDGKLIERIVIKEEYI